MLWMPLQHILLFVVYLLLSCTYSLLSYPPPISSYTYWPLWYPQHSKLFAIIPSAFLYILSLSYPPHSFPVHTAYWLTLCTAHTLPVWPPTSPLHCHISAINHLHILSVIIYFLLLSCTYWSPSYPLQFSLHTFPCHTFHTALLHTLPTKTILNNIKYCI